MDKRLLGLAFLSLSLWALAFSAHARPVSYPEGWTVMLRNDAYQNSAHLHYTIDANHSLGLRLRYDREDDFTFAGVQLNRLVKRWNKPDSQANLYARFGLGQVFDDTSGNDQSGPLKRADDEAIFLGISGDWETRKYYISAAAEHWDNGRFGEFSNFHGRLGFAPYVANTGALHTWIMIEGRHRPESPKSKDKVDAAALLRFFKGPALLEVGIDDGGQPLLNYIHRF